MNWKKRCAIPHTTRRSWITLDMTDPLNVLFVSHEASATGAVHSLLALMKWLKSNSSLHLRTICLRGGIKLETFGQFGSVEVAGSSANHRIGESLADIDVVLLNSAASASALPALAKLNCPIIVYVHELRHEISLLSEEERAALSSIPQHYVACSEAVAANLHQQLSIEESRITMIGEMVSMEEIIRKSTNTEQVSIHQQLGLPSSTKLVGAMGTTSWRKGVDLFLASAASYIEAEDNPNAHFIWIGGHEGSEGKMRIEYEIDRLKLRNHVSFLGAVNNPFPILKSLDVFCLTSREDPYPLVMIEAKALGIPVIGFAGSGGFDEFAQQYGATVVSPCAYGGMSKAIATQLISATTSPPSDLSGLDVNRLAPRFLEILMKATKTPRTEPSEVAGAADALLQQYYPVMFRILANGQRVKDGEVKCPVDKPWTLRLHVPENCEPTRLRLTYSSGPAALKITQARAITSGGKPHPICMEKKCKSSKGVTRRDGFFLVTGYQSNIHISLPGGLQDIIEIDMHIRRVEPFQSLQLSDTIG